MKTFDEDESVVCKIDGDDAAKRMRGDRVTVTQKRIYKAGMNGAGRVHRKVVNIGSVSAAEWGVERFLRFPVIGIVFFALCCLLAAYFLPHGKVLRLVLGIVLIAAGAAVLLVCIAAYIRCKIRTIVVYFAGGKMRIAAPGLSDEDAEEFVAQVLRTAESARSGADAVQQSE